MSKEKKGVRLEHISKIYKDPTLQTIFVVDFIKFNHSSFNHLRKLNLCFTNVLPKRSRPIYISPR